MPRSLADGRIKFTILTTKPVNPAAPTVTELNAGIQAECSILASDFLFGATDSDKVAEKALCVKTNANALGSSNYQAGFTVFRYFDATSKNSSMAEDVVWAAVKVKGTTLWVYARETMKDGVSTWVALDEIYLGAEVLVDSLQPPSDRGGYTKRRVPLEVQAAYENIAATAP